MLDLLWLILAMPFASALVLALLARAFRAEPWRASAWARSASRRDHRPGRAGFCARSARRQRLHPSPLDMDRRRRLPRRTSRFYLDALSLVMMLVVTFVGFLIHLYSAEFMIEDEGYSRFFAYMNLFVASMLTLLLADNLLLLYLGWEGVGLCSYLLIGFWYGDPANGAAARKAFIVTRVGDTAMLIGLVSAFHEFRHDADSGPDAPGVANTGRWGPRLPLRLRCCCWAAPWASRRSFRCRSGCRMPWPARRRPAR